MSHVDSVIASVSKNDDRFPHTKSYLWLFAQVKGCPKNNCATIPDGVRGVLPSDLGLTVSSEDAFVNGMGSVPVNVKNCQCPVDNCKFHDCGRKNRSYQQSACFFITTWLLFGWIFSLVLLVYLFFTRFCWISIVYSAWYFLDYGQQHSGQVSRMSTAVRRLRIFRNFSDYFPVTLVKTTDNFPVQNNYIFGYHPHGIAGIGSFSAFLTEALGFRDAFPGFTPHYLLTRVAFWWPGTREFFMALGASSATRGNVAGITRTSGNIIVMTPGGAAEALEAFPGTTCLVLKHRKGFIRTAFQNGCHLVPMFAFGENELYHQVPEGPRDSTVRKVQRYLQRQLGYVPIVFYGELWCPLRRPVTVVVGKPIPVPKIAQPTSQDVDELHRKYRNELLLLFYMHKDVYGYGDRTLEFV